MRLRPLDVAAFLLALLVIGALSAAAYGRARGVPQVHIRGDQGLWIYPLDENRLLSIAGPIGQTVVEIREGAVRVLSSPCPEQSCVRTGPAARAGQWIACLPNRVLVTLEGRDRGAPDAVSR